jgi:AcrR family transcriptional regulator
MNTRDKILEAANAAYTEKGYEKYSMRDVAARVGLTPMAIYKHFADKDHLLHHVQLRGFEMWSAQLDEVATIKAPRKRLIEIASAYLEFAVSHTPYFEMMFLSPERARDLKHITPEGAALIESVFERYAASVAECLPQAPDPKTEAIVLWGHNHGLVSLYLAGRLEFLKADFSKFHRVCITEYIDNRRKVLAGPGAENVDETLHYRGRRRR